MLRLLLIIALLSVGGLGARPYITVRFNAQFGNQLFLLATAYAYAKDHDYDLLVPNILAQGAQHGIQENYENFFSSISTKPLPRPPSKIYREPSYAYSPIPSRPNMELRGYFQSEKYFRHHRQEILQLFTPQKVSWEALKVRYPFLLHPTKVGVQVRINYEPLKDYPEVHPTFGPVYYARAFREFPEEALFVVASNNIAAARKILSSIARPMVFLEDTNRFEDMLILSRCEHLISSNSSFGWWAAWLGSQENRRCIFPMPFFHGKLSKLPTKDLIPARWEIIHCPEAILTENPMLVTGSGL